MNYGGVLFHQFSKYSKNSLRLWSLVGLPTSLSHFLTLNLVTYKHGDSNLTLADWGMRSAMKPSFTMLTLLASMSVVSTTLYTVMIQPPGNITTFYAYLHVPPLSPNHNTPNASQEIYTALQANGPVVLQHPITNVQGGAGKWSFQPTWCCECVSPISLLFLFLLYSFNPPPFLLRRYICAYACAPSWG
jgi:hypothetical protein